MSALPDIPLNSRSPEAVSGPSSKRPLGNWKRIIGWVAAGVVGLVLLIIVGVAALLHSERFHAYLLRTAQEKATEALGGQVQMRDFTLHWSGISPTVDLYNVVVHGAAPYSDPPLLEAEALHLGVTVTSLLHKAWYVGDVRIEHPVVRILADREGHTNIPPAKTEKPATQSRTSIFDLGIRHLLLQNGEIYYNDRKTELSAELHDLRLESGFELLTTRYSGTLSYRNGHLQMKGANPIAHNLDARFVATPEEFRLESADLTTTSSRFSIAATVRDYSQPQIHATYHALVDGGEFRRALNSPSLPTGIVQVSGVLDYDSRSNGPLLASINTNGDVRSTALVVSSQNARTQIRDIGARYSLAKGNAAVTGIHAQLLGGGFAGTLTMRDITGTPKSHLSATLNGISIAQVQSELQNTMASSSVTNQLAVRGSINATTDATWGKTMDDLLARADATLQADAQPAQGGTVTPVNGSVHARYDGRTGQLSFDQSYAKTAATAVTLNGTVSRNAALQVRVNSNDLHELETIAAAFRAPDSEPLGLYGQAALSATISGSTRNPQIAGQLSAENLKVRGSEWKTLRANVAASPAQVRLENGELDSPGNGRVTFGLTAGLQQWSFTKSSPFQVQIAASQMNVTDLLKAAGSTAPVSGILSADVSFTGTQLAPRGHGTIDLASARIDGEPLRTATLRFQGTGTQVQANLKIDLPAGSANATLLYEPKTQAYTAEVHAPGIKLDQLETVNARNLQLQGVLDINASGRGTLQDPQMQAVIEIPQFQVRDQAIRGLKLQTNVANHVANFHAQFRSNQHPRGWTWHDSAQRRLCRRCKS